MIVEILKALFLAGIPVALISYYFVSKTTSKMPLKASKSKEMTQELKAVQLHSKPEENKLTSMLHQKWLKFGGGFYGLLAFITYLHIELYQVIEFLQNFNGFADFIENIGFVMILNFFIEAIMNLVTAFVWPIYWTKFLPIGSLWVWIFVSFVCYSTATKFALHQSK